MVISSPTAKAKNYYTYSASGVKLRTELRYDPNLNVSPVNTTNPANDGLPDYMNRDYAGNIIYETAKNGSAITNRTRILVDGGYWENNVYYFYVTDHLGNNRVVVNQSGTVTQKNHYYPFGTAFADKYDNGTNQPYKYNGKELDGMHQLNLYDYSARYYESALGRFTSIDPLAEKYYSISPYAYCNNNPLKYIDPTGMAYTSSDPNQWNDLMEHLANGGSISSFNTNGWKETEDPKPPQDGDPQKQSESSKTITPFRVGVEWLTGKGARHRDFTDGDYFTELLKQHEHIENVRKGIIAYLKNGKSYNKLQPYSLSNWDGVYKYIKDYSTLSTFGLTGNLAVTYLGSYSLKWTIRSIDSSKGIAVVQFSVSNGSTIQSATHPPVIGYTDFWINNIGNPLDAAFSSGPLSKTTQSFNWTETLNLK